MQHRGLAVIKRRQATVDRGREIVWYADALAMRAERLADVGKAPLLALTPGRQPRLESVGLGGNALWKNPLHR